MVGKRQREVSVDGWCCHSRLVNGEKSVALGEMSFLQENLGVGRNG